MRINRKIGLSFFITFLLVILLGIVSIYSLKHMYQGLNEVFAKDLPVSRSVYQIAVSMEEVLSELNNFLITGNENFKINFGRSYKKMREEVSTLKRFIVKDEEKWLFDSLEVVNSEINKIALDIFERKTKMNELFRDLSSIEKDYNSNLRELFDFEEKKMLEEKDILLVQAQYIPASDLIAEAGLRFSNLLDNLGAYVAGNKEKSLSVIMEDFLMLEKATRDYKNYHGYSLSDKERSAAAKLIDLSGQLRLSINSIADLKEKIDSQIESLLLKEKDIMEALDKIIALKKSGISSKLGIGATLTEDIPAIHDISKIEKNIAESWRFNSRYILTGDETYKDSYYRTREVIDKELKDYSRHTRLRGIEAFLQDIIDADRDILETIDADIEVFEKMRVEVSDLSSIKTELLNKIDKMLEQEDSLIKKAKDRDAVLAKDVPARWLLMRLRNELSGASRLVINYINEQESKYKDAYSEAYFSMKKYVNKYRNLSVQDKDSAFIKEIEADLDRFNSLVLGVIERQDKVREERGWTLVKLEETLKERLEKAIDIELSQIEKNKKDLRNRIATINTLIFLIIGGVALIAVFIVFYTTRSITNPIQKLYNGAEIIGGGNLDHRLDIKTGDEIEELAGGFNKMAGELKELYTNLENKVKERTAQLADANKALALKNKELDDFTYIVSHDLKEPLRGVKAFTKLLIEDYSKKLDDEGKNHIKIISEASSRMTNLIEDLLNLSRIGRIKNIEPDVDLNVLVADVKKNLMYSLQEKNADLKFKEGFPKVRCDKIRISEVFSNLISNAVKYSKKNARPVIEVGYTEKGDFYEFYVKDNGIGIERQYFDKVFQIFQRLHAKGEYEGTGAGLAIVKKIVENHGGTVWLDSEPGAGSTFYFTLPKK